MAKFKLGHIVSTPGAIEAFEREEAFSGHDAAIMMVAWLSKHANGDWGDLCEEDKQENELSVKNGFRILSAYTLPKTNTKFWIITEADRSATTFLLPEEY